VFLFIYYYYCKKIPSGDKKKGGLATSTKDFVRKEKVQIAIFRL
jgi:hypothetical protein